MQHSRLSHGWRRFVVGLVLVFALFSSNVGTLFAAGTTGTITGTITDAKSGNAVASAVVNAVSPTGSYKATTDSKGFFSLAGVTPDTYAISFQLSGYEPYTITGVTVSADTTSDVSSKLNKSLSTIGRVTVRGPGGAFQPKQTQDTYTVTTQQINTLLGKNDATSEVSLLTRLPGASLDKYGYPVLRGGRENEEGYEFDGIPLVDAFTSQFTNSLELNGNVAQLQLTPGAGDVTTGGAGTGSINLIAKRGTYPAFGTLDAESVVNPYQHQMSLEYGFATPNGKISNYVSFLGVNAAYAQFGEFGTSAYSLSQGAVFDPAYETSRDVLDNFVFKFGRNNNQSLQVLIDNQQVNFTGAYGGYGNIGFGATSDKYALNNYILPYTGLTTAQAQQLTSLLPFETRGQAAGLLSAANRGPENTYQPNNTIKFQYSNNLSPSSFITAKYYELDSVATFDFANEDGAGSLSALQGGHRDGATVDFTTQVGSKHVLSGGRRVRFPQADLRRGGSIRRRPRARRVRYESRGQRLREPECGELPGDQFRPVERMRVSLQLLQERPGLHSVQFGAGSRRAPRYGILSARQIHAERQNRHRLRRTFRGFGRASSRRPIGL